MLRLLYISLFDLMITLCILNLSANLDSNDWFVIVGNVLKVPVLSFL